MAGLLDIFGTGGVDTMGLLGMSPADIQRNRDDAQAQALYALAGRLFQGGNTGASIAQGLQQGQQAYKGAMQGTLQDQLQAYQLQELKRKKELEQQALMRQQGVESLITQAYRPETFADTPLTNMMGQQIAGPNQPQSAGLGLEALAPKLMAIPEGRKALSDLLSAQKMMGGETTTLAEGANLVRINPFTGKVETVAQGAPKQDAMPTSLREFLASRQDPAYAKFLETQTAAKAPKFAVDMKDPTAVAKAQFDIVKDWRNILKDTGAMEVADRFKAAQAAVIEGNSGNKSADGALIYAIGKIYDPSGAVQEGDKQTILGNRSIPQSIKAYAQRALNGQSLLPEEREGLLAVATKVVESKAKNLEAQKAPYISISKQFGGNGTLLLNPLSEILISPVDKPSGLPTNAEIEAEIARRRKPS